MNISFPLDQPETKIHQCTGKRDGDWIVFTCPKCRDYENRINFKTGERKSKPVQDPSIFHQGSFVPVGLEEEQMRPN